MIYQYYQYPAGGERLQAVFSTFQNWGFQDFFMPFLLLFGLIYAILQRIGLFHTKVKKGTAEVEVADRKINAILGVVIALMIVIPHVTQWYPPDKDPINIINTFLPNSVIVLAALLLAFILVGLVSKREVGKPAMLGRFRFFLGLIGLIAVLLVIIKAIWPAFGPEWLLMDPNTTAVVIVIGVTALIIWFVMREAPTQKESFARKLETMFGMTAEEASQKTWPRP